MPNNNFNKAKSDLKHIEASCYGLPIACQDLCTYENAPIKFKTGDEMIDQITATLRYGNTYTEASKAGRAVAETRWLENDENLEKYRELYRFSYKDPERVQINSLEENK